MVKDYSKGKIYKIYPIVPHDEGDVYIGSTCRFYLCQRWGQHLTSYKTYLEGKSRKCSSYILFEKYGVDNCKCELIENYSCNDINELNRREGEIQQLTKCVNKNTAGRTKTEYRNYYMALEGKKERKMELQRLRRKLIK
jgi:hypothetical protein